MSCPFAHPTNESDATQTAVPPTHATTQPVSNDSSYAILGFHAANKEPLLGSAPTHYGSYLGIEQLLNLQEGPAAGKEGGKGLMHHEELTFIVVHQVFELWFKLVTADLQKARGFLIEIGNGSVKDASSVVNMITQCVSYLRRTETIFQHVLGAFGIMETMHPADFIEFRDFLIPASGFQSVSFRSLEQLLGVPNAPRAQVNGASVFSYLTEEEQAKLKHESELPSVNDVMIRILCKLKVPENFLEVYLEANKKVLEEQQFVIAKAPKGDAKAEALIKAGEERLKSMLDDPLSWSEGLTLETDEAIADYKKAVLAALFVISYRFENRFASLAALLDALIAVEEGMLLWRGRHLHMAERMIGRRGGTGGTSSGVGYLDLTRRYRIFHVLWLVRKLFIRASALPAFSTYGFSETDLFA